MRCGVKFGVFSSLEGFLELERLLLREPHRHSFGVELTAFFERGEGGADIFLELGLLNEEIDIIWTRKRRSRTI